MPVGLAFTASCMSIPGVTSTAPVGQESGGGGGGSGSLTVTGNVHVRDCPSDELADPVTVVVATGSLLPDAGFVETVTGGTPPVVVGSGHVTTAPSEAAAVTGATVGHVMVSGGGGGGLTVTGNVQVRDCPSDELADPVTVVVPTGSLLPDAGFVETVTGGTPPSSSGAATSPQPSEAAAVTGCTVGHVMVSGGGGGALTVTGNVHVRDCPSDELADPVTVVVPTGSLLPDAGFVETVTGTPPVVVGSGHVTTAPSEAAAVTGATVGHVMVSDGGGPEGLRRGIAEDACSFLTFAKMDAFPSAIARTSPVVLTVAMAALDDDHFTPVLFACSWTVCPFCRFADDGVTVNVGVTANVCTEVAAARPNNTQHTRMILANLTLLIFEIRILYALGRLWTIRHAPARRAPRSCRSGSSPMPPMTHLPDTCLQRRTGDCPSEISQPDAGVAQGTRAILKIT